MSDGMQKNSFQEAIFTPSSQSLTSVDDDLFRDLVSASVALSQHTSPLDIDKFLSPSKFASSMLALFA